MMIPAGYMLKRVVPKPEFIKAEQVFDIYSVSSCMSSDFADYIPAWMHNGFWFFDSPAIIEKTAVENSIDLSGTKLFYYELYEFEYDEVVQKWSSFEPEASLETSVISPNNKTHEGFDVVTYHLAASPECSPLSCNALAEEIVTNRHCLLHTLEEAVQLVENGRFNNSEPGPYRIIAVYSVE
jgi:hypothetical protein